jgi:hypothetical protein
MLKLDKICLVDAACVHPEIPQAIPLSLLCAEPDFVKPSLVTSNTSSEIIEGDLLAKQPGVREYSIGGHVAGAHQILRERDRAIMLYLKQSHFVMEELRSSVVSG